MRRILLFTIFLLMWPCGCGGLLEHLTNPSGVCAVPSPTHLGYYREESLGLPKVLVRKLEPGPHGSHEAKEPLDQPFGFHCTLASSLW